MVAEHRLGSAPLLPARDRVGVAQLCGMRRYRQLFVEIQQLDRQRVRHRGIGQFRVQAPQTVGYRSQLPRHFQGESVTNRRIHPYSQRIFGTQLR